MRKHIQPGDRLCVFSDDSASTHINNDLGYGFGKAYWTLTGMFVPRGMQTLVQTVDEGATGSRRAIALLPGEVEGSVPMKDYDAQMGCGIAI